MSDPPSRPQYRATKPVPFTLNERIRVALEETLYPQALDSLSSVITPGVSTPDNPPAAFVPPHTHIRLITTLITHPYLTTQLSKNEPTPTAPVTAFLLLRRILKLIGPLNADFRSAWTFTPPRARGTRTKKEIERDNSPSYTTDDHLTSELATSESLFTMAEDLWSIVGWAFTCSVLHVKRWRWWKLELEIVLDVLEADWEDRLRSTTASGNTRALEQAIIVRMLPNTTGSASYKKIVRAILANGSNNSLNSWNPIYKDELSTKRPKRKNMGSLDNTFIGDSDSDSDSDHLRSTDRIKRPSEDTDMLDLGSDPDLDPGLPTAVDEWGGMDALVLRQRFLSLISSVAYHGYYIEIEDLYHEYKDTILRFSISSFMLFTCTLLPIDVSYRSSLNQLLLTTIISSRSPAPRKDENDDLTSQKMIERYLPFPANTNGIVENAKVAALLENMMRLLVTEDELFYSQDLEDAVEDGIRERKEKVEMGKRVERNREREAREVWEGAEERLRCMVGLLKARRRGGGRDIDTVSWI